MVKHIVMWTLKPEAGGSSKNENLKTMIGMLEKLKLTVPSIRSLEVGVNFNPGPGAADIVLVTEFRDVHDLETYQNHPDHKRVADFIGKVRETRVVADYEF